jgi:hypothetical protein
VAGKRADDSRIGQQRHKDQRHDPELFPGYLVANSDRHTFFVLHCRNPEKALTFNG